MQTTYNENQDPVGYPGQLADSGFTDKVSVPCAAAVPFGKFVVKDTADGSGKLPGAATDITNAKLGQGLALASQAVEQNPGVATPQYPAKSVVPCLRKGRAWVQVEEAVNPTNDVYVRYAAGGDGVGSFRASAGTSEAAILANAKYKTSAEEDGFALVEFNL
jgi:hypothetical protein